MLAHTLVSGVRSAPDTLGLLVLIGFAAGWATRLGTLPGQAHPVLGPLVEGLAWGSLYVGLSVAYCAADTSNRESIPRVLRVIGLSLLLALVSTHLCHVLSATLLTPWIWGKLFYLKRLVPPVFVAFWCAALLPRETRALVRTVQTGPALAPLPHLAVLLASAAILVSCADLAFEWGSTSAVESTLKVQLITKEAWAGNVLILFSAYALVFALTSRVAVALLLVSPFYLALGLATLVKIRYMHSAVQPLDLMRIGEFLPFARRFLGTPALVAALGVVGLWISALLAARRMAQCPMSPVRRRATGLLALVVVLGVPAAYFVEPAPWLWRYSGESRPPAKRFLLVVVRAATGRYRDREFRETAREAGFLRSFLSELPASFVATPPGYSSAAVAGIVSRYCTSPPGRGPFGQPAARGHRGRVNLILFLVESFMDPADLGLHYTSDPMPNVRALGRTHISGYAIVPEEFGGSPTTEFEALTGMTASFLPEGSVAYRLYLKHPIPSLPSTLRRLGYATTVVRADPKYFYNHETAYRLLGFDRAVYLDERPGVDHGPRGTWPSDEAVVGAVMQAARERRPFFVLAFASGAYSPYNHGTFRDSDLDVLDASTRAAAGELKEYINAIRSADQAIGTLVEHFRHQPDSTIIAVLGDHLPPLSDSPLRTFFRHTAAVSPNEGAWMRRRVPLLVWANFKLPQEKIELTASALPSYLLEQMGLPSSGLLAVSDALRDRASIVTRYAKLADGTMRHLDSLPEEERRLVEDYRLLQYDALLGRQFAPRDSVSPAGCAGKVETPVSIPPAPVRRP